MSIQPYKSPHQRAMMLNMAGECGDDIVPSCQSSSRWVMLWLVWMDEVEST